MKKYIVLLICVSLGVGCAFMTPPAIRVDNAIEQVGRQYAITKDVSVAIFGSSAQGIADVFHDFGFTVVREKEKADYVVETETENLGWSQSWGYYMYPAKVRMRIKDNRDQEYFYEADGIFRYFARSGYGYYGNSTQHNPNDPYGLAAKIAAVEAIGNFIEEQGIPHYRPLK